VGAIIQRVVAVELDPDRLNDLFEIGIDEISWRKQDTKTADGFFVELGKERSARLSAVSMDMGKAFLKSVRKEDRAPQATICIDPFHVVALATGAR
jgi:transposase